MKVLVADSFEKSGIAGLQAAGCEVVHQPELADAALEQAICESGAEVLVVRGTKVTAAMLDAGRLSLVVRAGAGTNTIDVAHAASRGIYVSNCPGKNAIAVAELAFGLILALDRRIPDAVAQLRAGKWNKKEFSKAGGLHGRTLGLIGLGSIGQEMIRRAAGFGMPIAAWTRRFDGERRPLSDDEARELDLVDAARSVFVQLLPTPGDVAARADVLSIHCALTAETRGFVGAELLGRMKPGAMFVNTSRGEVVDHAALAAAVKEKGLRVGLDVFAKEPAGGTADFEDAHDLVRMPNVYGTHHVGASTDQAQEAIAEETVRIVRAYRTTGKVPNAVNLARHTPATHAIVVRHLDRPGVLAHVFSHLGESGINVQETENVVFDGARAAVARIHVDAAPASDLCERIRSTNGDILDLHVVAL